MHSLHSVLYSRRRALGVLAALGAGLSGVPRAALAETQQAAAGSLACIGTPEIEEGPFFVDERLNRSDLTADSTEPGVANGVPLHLAFRIRTLHGSTCVPLAGAHVDVWHADATGHYSDEAPEHTSGRHFLRGYQVTDRNGTVAFRTVFPGWYPGRTPHVHVKVRTYSPSGNVTHTLTTQLYFDDAVTDTVFARGAYAVRGARQMTNARDGLFDRRTQLALTRSGAGYAATFEFGLRTG